MPDKMRGFLSGMRPTGELDRKSTRLNSSHLVISYAVFCLEKKSTRLNSSHLVISYAVFCLEKKSTRLNSSHLVISYAVFCLNRKRTRMTCTHLEVPMSVSYIPPSSVHRARVCAFTICFWSI